LRIEREARKIAECTSYTPCILLSFSPSGRMDWTELGQQRYHRGSTAPAPALTSAHSHQQITNVEATSGHTAVLPFTWAPTARDQLASCFIVPPPAPQHTPSTLSFSTGSYSSAHFRAQHLKKLPETLAPTVRDRLASCFILPPSAPQYTPLALHIPPAPTFVDVPVKNTRRTALSTGKFLITIILPAHSSFCIHVARLHTHRHRST